MLRNSANPYAQDVLDAQDESIGSPCEKGRRGYRKKSRAGYVIAELPLALLALFIFGALPLIAFITIALRMAFVNLTCSEAVRDAAGSQSYTVAQTTAQNTIGSLSQSFTGILYNFSLGNNGSLAIYQTPLAPNNGPPNPQKYTGGPILTNQYLYQYQLTLPTQIQPIVQYSGGLFGNVPGWSAPLQFNVTASAYCENPQGLNQ